MFINLKDEYVNDDYFDYFKSQKWDVKTWNHLKITDQTIKKYPRNVE